MDTKDTFHLYSFFSSSCCQRIIIAAHLKSIPLTYSYIKFTDKSSLADYKNEVNFSGSVPTLVVTHADGKKTTIRQSLSILEYFEDRFPDSHPLLPPVSQPETRALVRDFVGIIALDVAPPTNSRIARRVKKVRDEEADVVGFAEAAFKDGFNAYEALLAATKEAEGTADGFSVGKGVTMADVVLVPTVDQALIWKMDMAYAPNVMRIFESLKKLPAFQAADWRKQEDTPEHLRQPPS
ncbi:hypothetical protein K4F52_000236 [Lecanicillium sp. MT-2017a]|nr:hypothetical protein K4F52_000236 [Lecanicillium sp. MT-2017a]